MIEVVFPTSKDVYIEVNGKKLAVVEGYKAYSKRESRYIESFGQSEPVGTVSGKVKHYVELSRIYICNSSMSDEINFFDLTNFNLVIIKPDKKIVYSGCEWSEINESAGIHDTIIEGVSLIATHRMEIT